MMMQVVANHGMTECIAHADAQLEYTVLRSAGLSNTSMIVYEQLDQ